MNTKIFQCHHLTRINIFKNVRKEKKKFYITTFEIQTGVRQSTVGTFLQLTGVGLTVGVPIASCSAYIASVAGLISNEYSSKLRMRKNNIEELVERIYFTLWKNSEKING